MNIDSGVAEWLERLEHTIEIMILREEIIFTDDAEKDKFKVSCLISNIGPSGYQVLKSYCTPSSPKDKKFEELDKLLSDNLAPSDSSALLEAYDFANMMQDEGENLGTFMSRLQQKANLCDFRALHDRMMRDRFLHGLRDEKIRLYLMAQKDGITTSVDVLSKAMEKEIELIEEKIRQKCVITSGEWLT